MIHIGSKEVVQAHFGKTVTLISRGAVKLWEGIRSCFGAGYWRGDKPWRGDEAWRS